MCKELILTWQNTSTRQWYPIARLSKQMEGYIFRYTNGAKLAQQVGFIGLAGLNEFEIEHRSETLFPLFRNRILNKSRPERSEFLDWLGLSLETYSEMEELARSGGVKVTDQFQLYPVPEKKNGRYQVFFFTQGHRYLNKHYQDRVATLANEERLYLCKDFQNPQDNNAMLLRTQDPVDFVGYVPRFLAKDFNQLSAEQTTDVAVTVVKVNKNAPEQMRLLCKFESAWPENFESFSQNEYQPIN